MTINCEVNLRCISFAILKALLPSLDQSDIIGARLFSNSTVSTTDQHPMTKFPSFIITLKHSELVQMIMRAKKSKNYFTTKDLDLLLFNSEVASALPDTKIFVNELLSPVNQLQYISIKETAKSLGFKYVWHCTGRFLVRWKGGMRAHEVKSISDLYSIMQTHKHTSPSFIKFSQLNISNNSHDLN